MTEEFPTQTTTEKDSNKKGERKSRGKKRGRTATHEALCITIF